MRVHTITTALLVMLVAEPNRASAQIGGLVKKAGQGAKNASTKKDKAAQTPDEQQATGCDVSDDAYDRLLKAMQAEIDGLDSTLETLPWGPTVVEMASYVKSLGCKRAMLLDGGVSGQLALRTADGTLRKWPNWRAVPLGLVVTPTAGH